MDGGPRILIAGGGYGGMHTALRLERLPRPGEATVMVADPQSYMTYQPLLAEAAAGNLEPRHVVVSLRAVLRRTQVIKAAVSSIDHGRRVACLATGDGAQHAYRQAPPPHMTSFPVKEEKEDDHRVYHR